MPVESNPQKPEDLNEDWPEETDIAGQGDDHLRNIKRVVKNLGKESVQVLGISPETSGNIALDSIRNSVAIDSDNRRLHFTGSLLVDSIISPVGGYIDLTGFPETVLDGIGTEGEGGCVIIKTPSNTIIPGVFLEGTTSLRIFIDASTIQAGDVFYLSGFYFQS